jgi:serine/threonine protein kinase
MVVAAIVIRIKFIHSHGVVHRVLKPLNILLDERHHPKIGDIGSGRFCNVRQK